MLKDIVEARAVGSGRLWLRPCGADLDPNVLCSLVTGKPIDERALATATETAL